MDTDSFSYVHTSSLSSTAVIRLVLPSRGSWVFNVSQRSKTKRLLTPVRSLREEQGGIYVDVEAGFQQCDAEAFSVFMVLRRDTVLPLEVSRLRVFSTFGARVPYLRIFEEEKGLLTDTT